MAHRHGAQRQVRGRQALGHRHQIGHDVPVIHGEPASAAPETGHHLVAHHQDPVPVAQVTDALEVAVGRDEDPVRPHDRLEEDRRDRVRALVADDILETLERLGRGQRLLLTPAMRVRVADHTHETWFVRPPARIAGQRHGPHGGPVIGAIAREHLRPTGEVPGELDRVLDRFRSAEGEEHLVEVARHDLGELGSQPRAGLRRERRMDELQPGRLLGDRAHDALVAVTDVHRHQLAVEVEDPLALGRVQVDALGAVDGDRVDRTLDRPRGEGVGPRERDDLGAGHRGGWFDGHVGLRSVGGTCRRLWQIRRQPGHRPRAQHPSQVRIAAPMPGARVGQG